MSLTLYSGTRNASSWAMRAWLALKEGGIAFDEVVVDIRTPQRIPNLARIGTFSPPAAVPVLVDGDVVIYDSLAIMEYANELASGALLPVKRTRRAQARAMVAWQHAGLSAICARLSFESTFYPDKRAMTTQEQAESRRIFDVWEDALADSSGNYLFGSLSLADLCFVPTVMRLTSHMPSLQPWPRASAWSTVLLDRAAVREWLDEAATLPPVYLADYTAAAH